jgi:hypothetical protein
MRKTKNELVIAGRLYDTKLALKTVQDTTSAHYGQDFISGTVDVATDEDCLNIVTVRFNFVQAVYKSGKKNTTYDNLKSIIDNGKTILTDGKDNATVVDIRGAVGLNDFYTNRNGKEELVSAKVNVGSFLNLISASKLDPDESKRNKFTCDMLINSTRLVEADEEHNIPADYLVVKGAVFDFRNAILPVEFVVKNKGGIQYFESLEASATNPVFTKVWGQINSSTVLSKKEEESAFGEPEVTTTTRTIREWVITGTSKPDAVYEIGDAENGVTGDEIKKAMADREIYLAEQKKKNEDYQASKNSAGANTTASAPASLGGFNF